MSGDNRFEYYNEPGAMARYALSLGVPSSAIALDYAGRRTYVVVDETSCPLEGWNDALRGMVVWRTLLSGDRTPTSQLTLGVTELGPGQPSPFPPHRHAQSDIYYVLSGDGVVQIEGEEHRLRAGTSTFIPGDAWHGARNTGGEPLRLLYVFAADSFGDVKYVFPAVAVERSPS